MPNIPNFTQGDRIKRGIQLYQVGVDLAKETLYARSSIETPGMKYFIG